MKLGIAHWVLIALAVGAFFYVQHIEAAAYARGVKDTEARYAVASNAGRKRKDANLHEIRRLEDDELVRRYCASSVFDVSVDECVRSDPLLP